GRDVDDSAPLAAHHVTYRSAAQHEGGRQVDGDDLVPFLVLHAHEEIVPGHARIVHEDVEGAELRLCLSSQLLDGSAVVEVAGHDMHPLLKLAGKRLQAVYFGAGDRNRRSRCVQRTRYRTADASRCTGDERTPTSQTEHAHYLPSAASAASTSAGVPTDIALASLRMRFTRPASTLPAPIS